MSQTVAMRRWSAAGAIATLLLLASVTALASFFGGGPARASSFPNQVFGTNPPTSPASTAPPTSAATPTTSRAASTTAPVPTTKAHATATTARTRVVTPTPNTAPRYQYQTPTSLTPTTPSTVAPTTTIVGINGQIPAAPVTLPLHTRSSNGHVNPAFAWLSGIGFAVALLLVGSRLYATRPGGRDRAPVA